MTFPNNQGPHELQYKSTTVLLSLEPYSAYYSEVFLKLWFNNLLGFELILISSFIETYCQPFLYESEKKKVCLDITHTKAGRELTHSYTKLVFQSGMTSNFWQERGLELHHIIYSNVEEENRNHKQLSLLYLGNKFCFRKEKRNNAFPKIKIISTNR